MRRRELVSSISLAAAGAVAPLMAPAADWQGEDLLPGRYDDFTDWLQGARQAGLRHVSMFGTDNPERLIRFLGLWASAMPAPPEVSWQVIPGANARLEMATVAAGRPFVVSAFRMAPGCVLPLHCHPGGGGITLCRSGALGIQHFDLCEGQPAFSLTGAYAEVVPISLTQLTPEHDTWFTPDHANLHQFVAGPEGAAGFEIAVQWKGAGEFSFLRPDQPLPPEQLPTVRRLRGQWVGMQLAKAYA
jgi:hypothetical protein